MSTTTVAPDDDIVSSFDYQDRLEAMTPAELHAEVLSKQDRFWTNFADFNDAVIVARKRIAKGEAVGGETVWSKYVNRYLRQDEEKLPTTLRRLNRVILQLNGGVTIDSSRVNHRSQAESRSVPAEETPVDAEPSKTEQKRQGCESRKGYASIEEAAADQPGPFSPFHCQRCGLIHIDKRQDHAPVEPEPAQAETITPAFPSYTITQRADGLFYDESGLHTFYEMHDLKVDLDKIKEEAIQGFAAEAKRLGYDNVDDYLADEEEAHES